MVSEVKAFGIAVGSLIIGSWIWNINKELIPFAIIFVFTGVVIL